MSFVRPKLEYASCVWTPLYYVHINRVERVQWKFIRFALRGLGWTDLHDLPPYEDRCALFHIDTLYKKRTVACIVFLFDILSGRVSSTSLWSMMYIVAPWYRTRGGDFLRARFHRTSYGVPEPFDDAV
jgi:hypothetical protein